MTQSLCDQVAERLALGEALGALTEHAAACRGCQELVAVSNQLGAIHHDVDPGMGFSARMTVGAQHRIAVRRRRRLAAGLAATVATGACGVLLVARVVGTPEDPPRSRPPALAVPAQPAPPDHKNAPATAAEDADLAALVQLADVDRSSRLSATWAHIKKPLAPYKKLLEGVTP